jgi:hypothetical protein
MVDGEERAGRVSPIPEPDGVTPAADNPTEMVALSVVASIFVIGGRRAQKSFNHAVLPEVEVPDL